jgi:hypothetical protein
MAEGRRWHLFSETQFAGLALHTTIDGNGEGFPRLSEGAVMGLFKE